MLVLSQKFECNCLFVTHYKLLTMSLLSERVQGLIKKLKTDCKYVHSTILILKALSRWYIEKAMSVNISTFEYIVAALLNMVCFIILAQTIKHFTYIHITVKALYFVVSPMNVISLEFNLADFAFVTLLQSKILYILYKIFVTMHCHNFAWYLISRKKSVREIREINPT